MTDNFERALEERLLARSQVSPRDVEALRLFARTLPARRSFWQRPTFAWALSAAAVVLAAVVALPVLFRAPGFGGEPTPAPTSTPAPTQPGSTPMASPEGPAPTPDIALGPIRLATASGSIVNVSINDPNGLVTGAVAEQAQATMSVRWFDSIVEAAGPNDIRVTWVGYPIDEEVELQVEMLSAGVTGSAGKLSLHFVQKAPPAQSDAEGEDRILVLTLAASINPENVEVTFSR
jgi:hypothetical protein